MQGPMGKHLGHFSKKEILAQGHNDFMDYMPGGAKRKATREAYQASQREADAALEASRQEKARGEPMGPPSSSDMQRYEHNAFQGEAPPKRGEGAGFEYTPEKNPTPAERREMEKKFYKENP